MTKVQTVRWSPFYDLEQVRDEMARLVTRFAGDGGAAPNWTPAVDVLDTPGAVVVQADLPGLAPEQIDIEVDENVLVIRGQRDYAAPGEETKALRRERAYGAFARSMTLPQGVRTDEITASFDAGVLTVTVPKAPEIQPRKIAVTGQADTTAS